MDPENGNGRPYRVLMEDEDLAEQFTKLFLLAQTKGLTEDEIGYGLFSATAESLIAIGQPECCVMQLLLDFTSSYYGEWHESMRGEDEGGEAWEDRAGDDV